MKIIISILIICLFLLSACVNFDWDERQPVITYTGTVSAIEKNTLAEFGTNSAIWIGGQKVYVYPPLPEVKIGCEYEMVTQGRNIKSLKMIDK